MRNRRLIAILLSLAMVLTFMPAMAFAGDTDGGQLPAPTNLHWRGIAVDWLAEWDAVNDEAVDHYLVKLYSGADSESAQEIASEEIRNNDSAWDIHNNINAEKIYYFTVQAIAAEGSGKGDSAVVQSSIDRFSRITVEIINQNEDGTPITGEVEGKAFLEQDGSGIALPKMSSDSYFFPDSSTVTLTARPDRTFNFKEISFDKDLSDMTISGNVATFTPTTSLTATITFKKSPTVPIAFDFGDKHADIALRVAEVIRSYTESYDCEVDGNNLTIQWPLADKLNYPAEYVANAVEDTFDSSSRGEDAGEFFNYSCGLKPLDQYEDRDEYGEEQMELSNIDVSSNMKMYVHWVRPVTKGNFTIEKPICGTKVKLETDSYEQENAPVVKESEDSELTINDAPIYWVDPNYSDSRPAENITIAGGKSYRAFMYILPKLGFFIDAENPPAITIAGTEKYEEEIYHGETVLVHASVTAEHDWGDWKVTKQPTTTSEGEETRSCKFCNEKQTRPIPKLNASSGAFVAKAIAKGKKSAKLSWTKYEGAERYVIYMAKCGKNYKKIKTVSASKSGYTKKGLKKNTKYKFRVYAQKKVNGKYQTVAKTKSVHVITGNVSGRYTNPKSLKTKPAKMTLSVGSSKSIKAVIKKVKSGKKLLDHSSKLRYKSSDRSVAKVSRKGKVTAVGKGTCRIYVQTINGIWKTVTVTVK